MSSDRFIEGRLEKGVETVLTVYTGNGIKEFYAYTKHIVDKNGKVVGYAIFKNIEDDKETYSFISDKYEKRLTSWAKRQLSKQFPNPYKEFSRESKTNPKEELEKALKGIEMAISLSGETEDLIKAKKGVEMALKLI